MMLHHEKPETLQVNTLLVAYDVYVKTESYINIE
jgi:hypothetical protein